jgi:hypothetical protein
MLKKKFLLHTLFLIVLTLMGFVPAYGQFVMKGKVVDAETLKPVEFATVFINNSTFGDITDRSGGFKMQIPKGNYELVISFMGYQTFRFPFSTETIKEGYEFRILPEAIDLKEAKVEENRDKIWYQNLALFQEQFLGSSINGKKSKILNPQVLVLDGETEKNKLFARGRDVLEIENPNLGYTVKYVLEEFVHDFQTNITSFAGYPFFIEQNIPKRRKKRIEEQRELAYEGSITHFIRALYFDKLEDEGFLVNKIEIIPNQNRPSDEEIEGAKALLATTKAFLLRDSLQQVLKKESLPKEVIKISNDTLKRGDLVEEARNGFLFLTFTEPFFVIFNREAEELNYRKLLIKQQSPANKAGITLLGEVNPLPVQITKLNLTGTALRLFEDGSYFHPFDLYLDGYMAWEKIGDLVPLDYSKALENK